MSVVFAERPVLLQPTVERPRIDSRSFRLESLDGSLVVPLDGAPVKLLTGAVGLEVAPVDVAMSRSPGIEGASFDEASFGPRPMLLPLSVRAKTQAAMWDAANRLAEVVSPGRVLTSEGSFRLVCSSASGTRQLTLAYLSGLEGDEIGVPGYKRVALEVIAADPFARDRESRSVEFSLGVSSSRMTSADPATAGTRKLGSSVVIGEDMPVEVVSGIPVWPRLDFTGPFAPLTVTASTGLSITVVSGVPAGSTLTVVTDPRNKSIRMDGQLAAGMVSRGSRIGSPFRPGLNSLNVSASGATEASRIVLSWRGGWRSLW